MACQEYYSTWHGFINYNYKEMKLYKDVRIFSTKTRILFLHHWVLSLNLELLEIIVRIPYRMKSKTYEDFFKPLEEVKKPVKKRTAKKKPVKKK